VTEEYTEFQIYRNQLQAQVNETTAYLSQLKSQPFDPKMKVKIDNEVVEHRQTYDEALVALRTMIDTAQQNYAKLAADETVTKTLHAMGRTAKIAPKLGPSHEFSVAVKLLEKLERETARTDSRETHTKPARGSRAKGT
jgi:hypothetical protein